ncbi:MAG: hypothetical protein ACRDD1_20355, partial [Planctomycetia bacterium]
MSNYIASLYAATGRPYRSVTGNPAMIHARARSRRWWMTRPPSRIGGAPKPGAGPWARTSSYDRPTASFEYVGAPRPGAFRAFRNSVLKHR